MRLSDALSKWALSQLEFMPDTLLRRGAGLLSSDLMLDQVLGSREASELRTMLSQPERHEGRPATVFLPGLMGSMLASVRGISSMLWMSPTVLADGHINLLDLDETGRADRSPDVEIVPVGIEKLSYLKIILKLAQETRLYEFPYDWRRHIEYNAQLLRRSILRWSSRSENRSFCLIGHSMGGLIIRTYMAMYPQEADTYVERVVLLASPIYGSAKTMISFSGQASATHLVERLNPGNDVLRFTLNMPSGYQLLPPPPHLFPTGRDFPANWDLYDAREWGVEGLRQDYLDDGRALYELLADSDPQVEMWQIAGCHQQTVTDVQRLPSADDRYAYALQPVSEGTGPDSGDDSVPLWSVHHPDVQTLYVQDGHQRIPGNESVINAVVDLVHGQRCELPDTLPPFQANTPLDRINVDNIREQVSGLRERIRSGRFTREDMERVLFRK